MTQEEKAKAYDEALERARKLYESYNRLVLSTDEIERIFPELAESDDERIRKGMIDEIKAILRGEDLGFPPQDVLESRLAYLEKQKDLDKMIVVSPEVWDNAISDAYENGKEDSEKQKEQKPVERSREDNYIIGFVYALLNQIEWKDNWTMSKEECLRRLNNYIPQPKQEWSEEDEKIRKLLIWQVHRNIEDETNDLSQSVYDGIKGHDPDLEESIEDWKKCLAWLKSLRPRSSWKPSEEQMYSLGTVVKGYDECNVGSVGYNLKELYEQLQKL